MAGSETDSKKNQKHEITWAQFEAFARGTGRDVTHVYRVFRKLRLSQPLEDEFRRHFGFDMNDAVLAGRKKFGRRTAA